MGRPSLEEGPQVRKAEQVVGARALTDTIILSTSYPAFFKVDKTDDASAIKIRYNNVLTVY